MYFITVIKKERPRVSDDIKVDDPSVLKRRAKKLEKQQVSNNYVSSLIICPLSPLIVPEKAW